MRTVPVVLFLATALAALGQDPPTRDAVSNALRRGVEFFRTQVAVEGTYLWAISFPTRRSFR